MKYAWLIWAGIWRKPLRTVLTAVSAVVAFLLFGILHGLDSVFTGAVSGARVNRLIVESKVSITQPLPISALDKIESVQGVTGASYTTYFGGYFRDPRNAVFAFAIDPRAYFALYPEYVLPPEALSAFARTRDGAVIGKTLARRYGWRVGQHISLGSILWTRAQGQSDWEFDIVGIYDNPSTHAQTSTFYLRQDYLDEARTSWKNTVSMFVVSVAYPAQMSLLAQEIDELFANSSQETRTQTEKEYTQAFLKEIADVRLIARPVMAAVFFTLLLVLGHTMVQSVRERRGELAVLKTVGFSDSSVSMLVLAEALVLTSCSAVAGIALAAAFFPSVGYLLNNITLVSPRPLPVRTAVEGIALSALLALAVGLIPSLQAHRTSIAKAIAVG